MTRRAVGMLRHHWVLVLGLWAASCKAPSSSSAPAAVSSHSAPSASPSAAAAQPWYVGTWSGTYQAKALKLALDIPESEEKAWRAESQEHTGDGKIDAVATAPINKEAIHMAGYKFQGHTEILAARTKAKNYAMMFVSDKLWIMLATTHLPLKDVSRSLDKGKILKIIKLAHETLFKLREKKPRIAVSGLNPHAGEAGIFGDEEEKIIKPAVEEAKKLGINVKGPISPDAVFYLANVGMYDIVIAMYHDQGLIPLKLLSFNRSVNVTVGLPIIRTSVDHGTGFDIAGKGWANPQSLIEAVKVAVHFAKTK